MEEKKKVNGVLVTALVGLVIATGAFFITFITSQKASETKIPSNIRLKPITIPSPPTIPPLKGSLPSSQSTISANFTSPTPLTLPSTSPSSESGLIASPSALTNPNP